MSGDNKGRMWVRAVSVEMRGLGLGLGQVSTRVRARVWFRDGVNNWLQLRLNCIG